MLTKTILKRIENLLSAVDNGEYNPKEYEFTIVLQNGNNKIVISDKNAIISKTE